MKTREVLEQAQQAMRTRQQAELHRQLRVLLNLLAKMQKWERRIAAMSQCPVTDGTGNATYRKSRYRAHGAGIAVKWAAIPGVIA